MAMFILQKKEAGNELDIESALLKERLYRLSLVHDYVEVDTLDEKLGSVVKGECVQGKKKDCTVDCFGDNCVIPIGTLDFVTDFFKRYKGIERMNPIEIPKYLRKEEFLKRDYVIVSKEGLPTSGTFFIKDVSELKRFGSVLNLSVNPVDELFAEDEGKSVLDSSHRFLVSEPYSIKSEWRVYVLGGYIENICNYNGDCTIFPDMNVINKAVNLIALNEKWLRSYTIDVMVGERGTALIEIHNFVSVGLYGTLWGSSLPWAYRDGIDYVLNDNKLLES